MESQIAQYIQNRFPQLTLDGTEASIRKFVSDNYSTIARDLQGLRGISPQAVASYLKTLYSQRYPAGSPPADDAPMNRRDEIVEYIRNKYPQLTLDGTEASIRSWVLNNRETIMRDLRGGEGALQAVMQRLRGMYGRPPMVPSPVAPPSSAPPSGWHPSQAQLSGIRQAALNEYSLIKSEAEKLFEGIRSSLKDIYQEDMGSLYERLHSALSVLKSRAQALEEHLRGKVSSAEGSIISELRKLSGIADSYIQVIRERIASLRGGISSLRGDLADIRDKYDDHDEVCAFPKPPPIRVYCSPAAFSRMDGNRYQKMLSGYGQSRVLSESERRELF